MIDPRLNLRDVERLVDAARKSRDGNYDIVREALEPFDLFDDDDDDTGPLNRYNHGCVECSVATDKHGIDRSGEDHLDHDADEPDRYGEVHDPESDDRAYLERPTEVDDADPNPWDVATTDAERRGEMS